MVTFLKMSTELQEIEKTLLALDFEVLKTFVLELLDKKAKKNLVQIPTRDATIEEVKAIEESLSSGLASLEEIQELENFLQMSLR